MVRHAAQASAKGGVAHPFWEMGNISHQRRITASLKLPEVGILSCGS